MKEHPGSVVFGNCENMFPGKVISREIFSQQDMSAAVEEPHNPAHLPDARGIWELTLFSVRVCVPGLQQFSCWLEFFLSVYYLIP